MVTDGSADVTKKEAVKSLGDSAERFIVQTWKKAEADS
jgi:hypothetical protein